MPRLSLTAAVVLVSLCVAGVSARGASAPDTPDPSTTEVLELRGTIGKGLAIHMHLEKTDVVRTDGTDTFVVGERYVGYYSYDRRRAHIELKGYFNAQGPGGAADEPDVELTESVGGKRTGAFIGPFGESSYSGRWEAADSDRSLPFSLRIVSRGPKR